MIENIVCPITGAARRSGNDIVRDEPSHLHIPRPSRLMRPDDEATRALRRLARLEPPVDAHRDVLTYLRQRTALRGES